MVHICSTASYSPVIMPTKGHSALNHYAAIKGLISVTMETYSLLIFLIDHVPYPGKLRLQPGDLLLDWGGAFFILGNLGVDLASQILPKGWGP